MAAKVNVSVNSGLCVVRTFKIPRNLHVYNTLLLTIVIMLAQRFTTGLLAAVTQHPTLPTPTLCLYLFLIGSCCVAQASLRLVILPLSL